MSSLLLQGGVVVDGTGAPQRRADVFCRDAKIVVVGDVSAASLPADTLHIDCDGLTVTPGFIDTHSHPAVRLFAEPTLPMKLAQGTTLEVLGQDGISVAPLRPAAREQAQRQLAGLLGDPRLAQWRWETVADYLDALTRLKPAPGAAGTEDPSCRAPARGRTNPRSTSCLPPDRVRSSSGDLSIQVEQVSSGGAPVD